jgi:putative ABC transport system permease protein
MCACAVLVCTLFLNFGIDLAKIKAQITGSENLLLYELIVSSGQMNSAVTGGALALTTMVMLVFYIKHYIDTHKPEFGILKALGYSNWKIAKGFWVFGLSVLAGAVIGFALAFAFMPAFYEVQLQDTALPQPPLHFNPILALYLLVLPALVFAALAVLYSYRKLRRPPLELIRGKAKVKTRKSKPSKQKDTPFLRDLTFDTLRSRKSLVFFVWLSAFVYAATVVMSFSISEVGGSGMMAVMMAVIGVILAVTTIVLAVSTMVSANAKTIAMLRVFGYSERECASAILSGYRPVTYVGFLVGTAYQHGLMLLMMELYFGNEAMALPDYEFNVRAFCVALISFVALYEVFIFFYAKRIRRIPLKEVMQEE